MVSDDDDDVQKCRLERGVLLRVLCGLLMDATDR